MTDKPKSVAEVLDAAADFLALAGVWNCQACTATAIWKGAGEFFGTEPTKPAQRFFASHVGLDVHDIPYSIYRWNDAPERTQAEVVAKLREAASLAREQGL